MKLLNKYNKKIPKTWDELFATGKYIMERERKLNNTDIVIYNGLFAYDELGTSSIYEFIYSYRDHINDPFPEFRSKNALEALKMMKILKNEISSDKYYQDIGFTTQALTNGNGLFIKSNHIKIPTDNIFKASVLPGHYEGVSSTFIGGDNISINKYIDKRKVEASIKALIYMTSKEVQKRMIAKFNLFTGIYSLYEDKEVCNTTDLCDIYKNIQTIVRPISKTNNYLEYSQKIRKYILQYLYGGDDVDPEEMLRKVDDITRIYYISMNSKATKLEKLIVGLYATLIFFFLLCGVYLYIIKCKKNFNFFSRSYWSLTFIGHLLLIFLSFVDIQKVSVFKCHLKLLFQFISFTLIYIPFIYKFIDKVPEKNKTMGWISRHPHLFITLFIMLDLIFLGLMHIQPFVIKNIVVSDDKNFQKCKIGGTISLIFLVVIILFKFFIFSSSIFFIILEWHMKSMYHNNRFYISLFSIDSLIFIILNIFTFMDFKYYNIYFLTRELLILLIPITNIILYSFRIILFNSDETSLEDYSINDYHQSSAEKIPPSKEINYNTEFTSSININNNSVDNIRNIKKKSLKHYLQTIKFNNRNEINGRTIK